MNGMEGRPFRCAAFAVLALAAFGVSACTENTAKGNDREAQTASRKAPAEPASPEQALRQAAIDAVEPETMIPAEIAKFIDADAACEFAYAAEAFPIIAVTPSTNAQPPRGVIKLNGKLVELHSASTEDREGLADGVTMTAGSIRAVITTETDAEPIEAGQRREADLRLSWAGSSETGFHGFYTCRR